MISGQLITIFLALFTICNPVGSIPLFLSLTEKQTAEHQRRVALGASVAVMVIFLVTLFLGQGILNLFSININAFRLGGSFVVIVLAWSMINVQNSRQRHTPEEHRESTAKLQSVAVVPLAIPILAGPGAISTLIGYTGGSQNPATLLLYVLIIVLVSLSILVILLLAPYLQRIIHQTGMNIMTRIFGILLLSIGIGDVVIALKALFPLLAR
jgi:multiple antibiotic resistance protein